MAPQEEAGMVTILGGAVPPSWLLSYRLIRTEVIVQAKSLRDAEALVMSGRKRGAYSDNLRTPPCFFVRIL